MSKDLLNLPQWFLMFGLYFYSIFIHQSSALENNKYSNEHKSRIFSPRMDYDEWTPLGQGDPLKNDPTFDYVPPVLDRVQYWLGSYNTEASTKHDILVLGVTTKKIDSKNPNEVLKLVDAPTLKKNQDNLLKNYFTRNLGTKLPKIIHAANFRRNIIDFQNQNKIQPSNYFLSHYYNREVIPYTIMLPPPVILKQKNDTIYNNYDNLSNFKFNFDQLSSKFSTQTEKSPVLFNFQEQHNIGNIYLHNLRNHSRHSLKAKKVTIIPKLETIRNHIPSQRLIQKYESTEHSISFEKSNLIYQSTEKLSRDWLQTNTFPAPLLVKKQKSDYSQNTETIDHTISAEYEKNHQLSASSNHKVIFEQNYVDRKNNNNEDNIIGQQQNSDINKNHFSSEHTKLPQIILLNIHQNNTIDDENNSSSTFSFLSTQSYFLTSVLNEKQMVRPNSSTKIKLNHQKFIKNATSAVIPIDYNKQIKNSSAIEKLNKSKNLLNTNINIINHIDKSLQIAKPQFFENFTTASTLLVTPSQNYLFTPLFLNKFIATDRSNLSVYPIKTSTGLNTLTNMTFLYSTSNIHASVPIKKFSTRTLLRKHSANHTDLINNTFNNVTNISLSINEIREQEPSLFQRFTNITNPVYPSTLESQSIQVKNTDQRYQDLCSKKKVILPPVQSTLSTSSQKLNFNNHKTKIQSVLPQISIYGIKTMTYFSTKMTTMSIESTTASSLTTDPIFSHYKQPAEPMKGPMYLIIQGHSKVKTYKPTLNKYDILIGTEELMNNTTQRAVSKLN